MFLLFVLDCTFLLSKVLFQKGFLLSQYQGSDKHGYFGVDFFTYFGHLALLSWASYHLQCSCHDFILLFAPYGIVPFLLLLGSSDTQPLVRTAQSTIVSEDLVPLSIIIANYGLNISIMCLTRSSSAGTRCGHSRAS